MVASDWPIFPTYVFVYGTLKRERNNNHLLKSAFFCEEAISANNYVMTGTGVPFLWDKKLSNLTAVDWENTPQKPVKGEIYRLTSAETLRHLDKLESHPNWYRRHLQPFFGLSSRNLFEAWVYIMQSNAGAIHGTIVHDNARPYWENNPR